MDKTINTEDNSRTALLTTFFRAVGHLEFGGQEVGADDLAINFLPGYLRLMLKKKGFRAKAKAKYQARMPGIYEYVLARTVFFDGLFATALNDAIPQIVMLGAGYDSRAYRFVEINQGTRVIEVDTAPTQEDKLARLKKRGIAIPDQVSYAAVDFNVDSLGEALRAAGYEPGAKTLFIWEGVSMYLEPPAVDAMLGFVGGTGQVQNIIAFDYAVGIPKERLGDFYGSGELARTLQNSRTNEAFRTYIPLGGIEEFLAERGLKLTGHMDHEQIENDLLPGQGRGSLGRVIGTVALATASPA